MIVQLRLLQRVEGTAGKFDRESWEKELVPILNLWKKLNQACEHQFDDTITACRDPIC